MTNERGRRGLGSVLLLLTAVIWGFAFAFQRDAMISGIGPFTFSAMRMLLAAVVVWSFVLVSERLRKGEEKDLGEAKDEADYRRNTRIGGALVGLSFAAAVLVQQVGIAYTTAGKAGFLSALYLVLVPVISTLVLHKRYRALTWAGVGLGLAGLYFLSVSGGFTIAKGDLLCIGCAFLFATQIILIERYVDRADPLRISAIELTICALASFVMMAFFERPTWAVIRDSAVSILYCGVLSAGLGYTFQIVGQRSVEPTTASLLMSLESLFSGIGGALLLGERMSGRELFGCALMFAAVILVQVADAPGRKKKEYSDG